MRCFALILMLVATSAFADAERDVVWYTAMNLPDTEALRRPFNQRYPLVKLTVLRATGEKVRTRILTEARAGRFGRAP